MKSRVIYNMNLSGFVGEIFSDKSTQWDRVTTICRTEKAAQLALNNYLIKLNNKPVEVNHVYGKKY